MRPTRLTTFTAGCLFTACLFGQSSSTMPATSAQEMQPGEMNGRDTKMISGYLVDASCARSGPSEKMDHAMGMNRNSIPANNDRASDPMANVASAGTTDRGLTGTNLGSNTPSTNARLTQRDRSSSETTPMATTDGQGQAAPRSTVREMSRQTQDEMQRTTMNGVSTPTEVTHGASTNPEMKASASCPANSATTRFAIVSEGHAYALDEASNQTLLSKIRENAKFQDALSRNETANARLTVTAKARMDGDTLHVFTIRRGK